MGDCRHIEKVMLITDLREGVIIKCFLTSLLQTPTNTSGKVAAVEMETT